MGYYNNYTSAHRNGYYVSGAEYNKMQMQAEMTAEAYARQNPGIDMKAFATAQADAFMSALRKDREAQQRDAEIAEWERRRRAEEARLDQYQSTNANKVESILHSNQAVPANLPTSYEDAVTACDYIRKHNAYLKPWNHKNLTADYRNLLQAFLNKASAGTIQTLTQRCVNNWKNEISLLNTMANYHADTAKWEKLFQELVS